MKTIKRLMILVLSIVVIGAGLSLTTLTEMDWCILKEKADRGKRVWDKNWDDEKYETITCEIKVPIEQYMKVMLKQ